MGTVELKTERLILRKYIDADAEPLYQHFGRNHKMYELSGWNPYATEEMAMETVQQFINSYNDAHFYGWAIEYDNELVGTVGAYDYDASSGSIEVGISIKEDCWGKGFATETLICVLNYLTNSEQINSVTAWCVSKNIGSINAMKKAGMKQVGAEKDSLEIDGKLYDKLVFCYTA